MLCSDSTTASLHRELLTAPQSETRELLGTTVVVATKAALDERARIAWQLSWLERMSAWNLLDRSNHDDARAIRHGLQPLLAQACESWPELMRMCLALAELFVWTFYRGGLGIAMRFSSERTSSPFTVDSESEHAAPSGTAPLTGYVNTLPSPTIVTGAIGVIIDYDGGSGHIVVKHPTIPSLTAAVKEYVESKPDSHSWIVPFDWNAIDEADRKRLHEFHEAKNTRRQRGGVRTLDSMMRGMTVHCELQKVFSWEVTSMSIAFTAKKFNIPIRRPF